MNNKKIFFVAPANNIHTIRWVNELCNYYEVHLIFCKNHGIEINKVDEKVILHSLKVKAPYGYYLNSYELRNLYKKIKPDLINVHYASGYGTLVRCAKIKPVILSIWGSDIYEFPNKSKMNRYILKKNVLAANIIASTSNIMAKELKKQVPELAKDIHITPFGVDTEKFKKKDIAKDAKYINIVNIKALEEIYGIKDLILSVDRLRKRLIENNEEKLADKIKLYVYGEGSQRTELEKLIKNGKMSDYIFLKGKIPNEEVPNILNKMDIFCATSISESFGVAVVEAMACELPIVATKVDGFLEVMEEGKTGYLVEKENIDAIAETLEKLVKNEKIREKFGINGRKRVIEKYEWKENVNKMRKVYKKIIEETSNK